MAALVEWIKLVSFVVGGVVVIGVGFYVQKKMMQKKAEEEEGPQGQEESTPDSTQTSQAEQKAKQYIETYKTSYSRDALKQGLVAGGFPEADVEAYLNRYY